MLSAQTCGSGLFSGGHRCSTSPRPLCAGIGYHRPSEPQAMPAVPAAANDNPAVRLEQVLTEHAGALAQAAAKSCPQWLGISREEFEQEIRIRLWKALAARSDLQPNAAYVFRTAATAAIDLIRSHGNRKSVSLDDPDSKLSEILGEDDGAVAAASAQQQQRLLHAELQRLDTRRRTVLKLYLQGFALAEIAELSDLSVAAARNLVYRAADNLRAGMRKRLKGDSDGDD